MITGQMADFAINTYVPRLCRGGIPSKKSNWFNFDQQALALDRIGPLVACLVQSLWQLHAESAMI
jgi:hypothetical protein